MATIMDLSFPGQWTTTGTSCIPHDSVYMPGPRAGKSENGVLSEQRATKKKYQNEDFAKNGRKNFRSYTMMRKRRKCFALFARKQREKFHLQVVDASTSNNQCSKSMQRTMATKCAIVWETCLGIWNKTVFFIVILDSKYSKMTPKFVKQKSHWLHSSIIQVEILPFKNMNSVHRKRMSMYKEP